jgi:hypothetical protein
MDTTGWIKMVERHETMVLHIDPRIEVRKVTEALRDIAGKLDLLAPSPEATIGETYAKGAS